jgi:hypothetical protein
MLDISSIEKIAGDVVRTQVSDNALERIFAAPTTDSEGKEALRITLILKTDAARKLTGHQALDVQVDIRRRLLGAGEERFPLFDYATEQEFQDDGQMDEQDGDIH